jgi:hypothetical protein
MANYFRRLTCNKDGREAVALALTGIVLLILAYLVVASAISHMPAPFGSLEELMKP